VEKVGFIELDDCLERLGIAFLQGRQDLATPGVVTEGLAAGLALVTLMLFEKAEPDYVCVRAVRADETAEELSLTDTLQALLVVGRIRTEDLFDDEEELLQVLSAEALQIVGDILNVLGAHPGASSFHTGHQGSYRQGLRPTLDFKGNLQDYDGALDRLLSRSSLHFRL
jgi:hypothetical protein